MTMIERPDAVILPWRAAAQQRPQTGNVLAVVGGKLDGAVLNLARALARDGDTCIDLVLLVEVLPTFPLLAYGRWMQAQGIDATLDAACEECGDRTGEASILLCRSAGAAMAAEARERGSADLVIGAPAGGWWARRRAQAAIGYVQKHAECRVFVVHVPPPPEPQVRRVAAR
ncbi:MAG TPA: hypothetical protein VHB98_08760 [Chloroflexota bacterium]|jgi:hypothetical protein|nr:hypothetical protein [Chloroflexota bacterium]